MNIGTLWLDVEVDPEADNYPTADGARAGKERFYFTFYTHVIYCYLIIDFLWISV